MAAIETPTVVIDPGHGGSAPTGGSSPNNASGPNGLLEKDVTLDLGRRVAAALGSRARVVLTRSSDENRSLGDRARVSRDANASVFLSIHMNGFNDPSVDGSEAWVARHANDRSRRLARSVLDGVVSVTRARDRGVREEDLGVLLPERHAASTAATLLEVAFLTNPDEAHRLETDAYRQQIAQAIADAVATQLGTNGTAQSSGVPAAQSLAGGNGSAYHGASTVFDTPTGIRVHTHALSGSGLVKAAPTTIFLPAQGGGYEDYIQAQTKGDLMPLINGRSWNPATDLTEPLDQMQTFVQSATAGDRVYLSAWYFEPQTQLTLGSYASPTGRTADDWGQLFAAKAAEGVTVRILQTDFDATFFKDSHDAIRDPWYAYVNGLIAGLPAGTQDNLKYVVSMHPAHTNLLRWVGGGSVNIASHHQKFMIVKRGEETTAFCGGLDIESRKTPRRWANPPTHARPLSGWHDIHLRLQGPIARDLEKEFALRWNRDKDASGMPAQPGWSGYETLAVPAPPAAGEADAAPEKQIENVQMIRTVSVDGGLTSAYDTKRDDIIRVYKNIVASAESFLYFENQYFRSSDLAAALEAAAAASPSLIAIFVVVNSSGQDDADTPVTRHGDYLEREFFRRVTTAFGTRAAFFTMPWRAVHSKFLLGDDRMMTIGSANANDRGFKLDSELNVAIDDAALTSRFRKRLWAWDLGVTEADVATWGVSDYLDKWRQIATSNKTAFDAAFDPVAHTVNVPAIEAIPGECVIPFDWTTLPGDTTLPIPDVLASIDFDPGRDQGQTDGVPDMGDGGGQTVAASLETEDEIIAAHPGTLYGVDVAGIATALLGHLPGEPELVGRVFDKLLSTDRDDVAQSIAEQAPDATIATLGTTPGGRVLVARMVTELQDGPTTPGQLAQMERLIRVSSPMHARLKDEPWNTDAAVTGALAAAGASIQPITDGVGPTVFDEYAVTVDTMPPGVTPEAFLGELALDPNGTAHNPSFDTVNVFHRRASSGPPAIGDIYDIDIAGPDNGSVVIGELASDHFVFQTITTRFAETGSHPECGARAFGFERNADGSVTFYTRGASRIAPAIAAAPGGETIGVVGQGRGWTQLMIGIAAAIQARGGSARPNSFRTWTTRP
jgi:N-acetylmuramoyl-L-alanine amidase/phosphatidylserine/phosphatidylglycerophosphate/cardiolipin synthase-like enzyme